MCCAVLAVLALLYPFMEKGSLQQRLYGRSGAGAGLSGAPPAPATAEPLPCGTAAACLQELRWGRGDHPEVTQGPF